MNEHGDRVEDCEDNGERKVGFVKPDRVWMFFPVFCHGDGASEVFCKESREFWKENLICVSGFDILSSEDMQPFYALLVALICLDNYHHISS